MDWLIFKGAILGFLALSGCAQLVLENTSSCCLNGTEHKVGNVVAEFKESCLSLICAVNQNKLSSPEILALQIPSEECLEGTPCRDCYDTSCVDEFGRIHSHGSSWMPNECTRCKCGSGQIVNCSPVAVSCPRQPDPSCERVESPCCPVWECIKNCVDEEGRVRELGEEWGSPCIRHFCTISGIATRIEDCIPLPFVNDSCEIFTAEDKCCPEFNCGCKDNNGGLRELNEQWGDSCTMHSCTTQGVSTKITDCLPVQPLNKSCEFFTPENQCCPELRCGCVDEEGGIRVLDEEWGTPCIGHICTPSGIVTLIKDCAPSPKVNASCEFFTPDDECCPILRCGCLDKAGNLRKVGEEWGTCMKSFCTDRGIVEHAESCQALKLNATCHTFLPKGQCCPVPRCGCVVNGEFHELNSRWEPEPCMLHKCTANGIEREVRICQLQPKPGQFCHQVTKEGKCCPEWDCSDLCKASDGTYRKFGESWGGPCKPYTCTLEGIVAKLVYCPEVVPHNSSCHLYTPKDECCPQMICGVCMDSEGRVREINETWGGPCILNKCTPSGIIGSIVTCPTLLETNESCRPFTAEGQCCPQLRCGCIDEEGDFREFGAEWQTDPCTLYRCTDEGILKSTRLCKLGPKPDPECVQVTKEEDCCPVWECDFLQRKCLFEGKTYDFGEEFYDPIFPCRRRICMEDGILETFLICSYDRPNPWCVGDVPKGKCCNEWICSGCADEFGGFIPLGTEWETDPCTSHECTRQGQVTTKKNCTEEPKPSLLCKSISVEGECCRRWKCLDQDPCTISYIAPNGTVLPNACAPPPEAPHPNCELIIPEGGCCQEWECGTDCRLVRCGLTEKPGDNCLLSTPRLGCCPEWNCSGGCVDDEGEYHQLGDTWVLDCVTLSCTSSGIFVVQGECNLPEAPHSNCRAHLAPGECCHEWKCGEDCSLVDCSAAPSDRICEPVYKDLSCCPTYECSYCIDDGKIYNIGEEWPSVRRCTTNRCTDTGITSIGVSCRPTEQPNPSCYPYALEGDCCPIWKCNCLDLAGIQREIGSRWENNCIAYNCNGDGTITESPVTCVLDEPEHFNCIPFTPRGQCCPKWNCGPNCAAVLCAGPPHENCVADPLLPLSCCSTYTCSSDFNVGCELGKEWKQNCLTYNCTVDGIKVHETPCLISPPPAENCELTLFEGSCCLEWNCGTGREIFPEETQLVIPIQG